MLTSSLLNPPFLSYALSISSSLGALLSLLLAIALGMLAVALGQRLLIWLGVKPASGVERMVFAAALGLGTLGYGFLLLGFAGLLRPWAIWTLLAAAALVAWSQMRHWSLSWRKGWRTMQMEGLFEPLGATLLLAMLVIVSLRGLAPVTDYDGLTYHLVVPRDYLEAGRVFAVPGEAHPNFPLTVDLLFIPAISLGLENSARLIHVGFGVLTGLGVFALGRRILGTWHGAWLALFVFGTTPVIGTVSAYAHHDLGWVLFEFLATYAILVWTEENEWRWLVLAGVSAGLGLGSKYLGLPVLGILGVTVLVHSSLVNRRPGRTLRDGLLFGLVALAVAAPWYIKNWVWLGNPVYPLWFGGNGWDAYLSANLQFMGTHYGPRRGIWGILLLPWDLFRYSIGYFGPIPFAFPTPLSLLLPLYLLVRRHAMVSLMLMIALLRFATWAVSARNARYLMDIYPLLSVAVAYVLAELARRQELRVAIRGLVLVLMTLNLAWQALLLQKEDPIPVVLGLESREAYLAVHNDPPYQSIRFINQLPANSRVLFVGNGQGYYATTTHIADADHGNWGHLIYIWGEDPNQLHTALTTEGITHLYYSAYDFTWRLSFDSEGAVAHELAVLDQFLARCASLVYDNGQNGQVYMLLEGCEVQSVDSRSGDGLMVEEGVERTQATDPLASSF